MGDFFLSELGTPLQSTRILKISHIFLQMHMMTRFKPRLRRIINKVVDSHNKPFIFCFRIIDHPFNSPLKLHLHNIDEVVDTLDKGKVQRCLIPGLL